MSFFSYDNMQIMGIAAAVPTEEVLVNSFIPVFGEETVRKSSEMTGVRSFRRSAHNQTASDLGFCAAEYLMKKLAVSPTDIGILIFTSLSQDYLRPPTACVLHKRLKLLNSCAAFDLGLGCSGFVYGLQVAAAMLSGSDSKYVLLITSETASKLMYPKDRSGAMLVGDAGTAVIIRKKDGFSLRGLLGTDGEHYASAIVPAGGFRNPDVSRRPFVSPEGIERTHYHYLMNGLDIFSFSVNEVPKAVENFYAKSGTTSMDYDCFVPHQANNLTIKQLRKKLGFSAEKVAVSLDRYGNTSSAAIPLTLCDAYGDKTGSINTLMCGFGTGLSYGVVSATLNADAIFPVIETDEIFTEAIIHDEEE